MKEKRKFIYTLILFVVALFTWFYFFYYPLQTDIKITESEMIILKSKINSVLELSKNMDTIREQHLVLQNEILNAEEKILSQSSINNLVYLLKKEMQNYNIKILAVSPIMRSLSGDKSHNYKYLPLEMKIEAKFLEFAKFLDDLDRRSFILKPEGISMVPKNENSNILSIDFRAKILIKTGEIYENI
jgi:Tfp pilus assembly protein PilO